MSNISSQLCNDADSVANSFLFKLLIFIKMVLCLLGSICVIILFKKKRANWIPNPNAKILYHAHIFFAFHAATGFILIYVFDLIRMSISSNDPCHYVINARFSCAFRLIPVLGAVAQSFNMFTFAIERAISTIYIETYERLTSKRLGVLLVILSVIAACLMHLICTYLPISEGVYVASLTIRTPENSHSYQVATFIPFCLEISTFTIFGLTYYFNERKGSRFRYSGRLGRKYQISENKLLIRTLYPCFLIHFLLSTFTYVGIYLYPVFFPTFTTATNAIWVECFSQSPNYALFMPWILMWQKKRSNRVDNFGNMTASDLHFKRFNEMLNKR